MIPFSSPTLSMLTPPGSSTPPPWTQRVRDRLVAGIPATVALTAQLELLIAVPDGVGDWRAGGSDIVVSAGGTGLDGLDPVLGAAASHVRPALALRDLDRTIAALPAVAGASRILVDGDGMAIIGLVVIGWSIRLGSLITAGDHGSWIAFAWWSIDRQPTDFGVSLRPRVRRRVDRGVPGPGLSPGRVGGGPTPPSRWDAPGDGT